MDKISKVAGVRGGAVIVAADEFDDDLWDFSTPGGLQSPHELESSDSSGDEMRALPASKRRRIKKLEQRLAKAPDMVGLEGGDKEGKDSDSDLEIVVEVKRAKASTGADEFDFVNASLALKPPVLPKKTSARDKETQAALLRNREALARVREMVNNPLAASCDEELEEEPEELSQQTEQPPAPVNEADKVIVKLQTREQKDPVLLRVAKTAPLERLFHKFEEHAEGQKWITAGTQLRFVFDGEQLSPEDTAESADIEDDCVVEVYW